MQVFDEKTDIAKFGRGHVAAIGNFDGVHLGHRYLITAAINHAETTGSQAGILTFSPHPRRYFDENVPPFRLTSRAQKARVLGSIGADFMAVETFNSGLASLSPEDFVSGILVQKYGFSCVVVGFNFRFGHKAAGDADLLREIGRAHGLEVIVMPPAKVGEETYASSQVREYIRNGNLDAAEKMLGWRWEIDGPVLHGDKRGRELGYPTANQSMRDYVRPPYGVYAVRATLDHGPLKPPKWFHGVANLGVRPMFKLKEPLLETYIFDFNDDIYDQNLRVELIHKLRGEQAFSCVEDLIEQMRRDEKAARRILSELK